MQKKNLDTTISSYLYKIDEIDKDYYTIIERIQRFNSNTNDYNIPVTTYKLLKKYITFYMNSLNGYDLELQELEEVSIEYVDHITMMRKRIELLSKNFGILKRKIHKNLKVYEHEITNELEENLSNIANNYNILEKDELDEIFHNENLFNELYLEYKEIIEDVSIDVKLDDNIEKNLLLTNSINEILLLKNDYMEYVISILKNYKNDIKTLKASLNLLQEKKVINTYDEENIIYPLEKNTYTLDIFVNRDNNSLFYTDFDKFHFLTEQVKEASQEFLDKYNLFQDFFIESNNIEKINNREISKLYNKISTDIPNITNIDKLKSVLTSKISDLSIVLPIKDISIYTQNFNILKQEYTRLKSIVGKNFPLLDKIVKDTYASFFTDEFVSLFESPLKENYSTKIDTIKSILGYFEDLLQYKKNISTIFSYTKEIESKGLFKSSSIENLNHQFVQSTALIKLNKFITNIVKGKNEASIYTPQFKTNLLKYNKEVLIHKDDINTTYTRLIDLSENFIAIKNQLEDFYLNLPLFRKVDSEYLELLKEYNTEHINNISDEVAHIKSLLLTINISSLKDINFINNSISKVKKMIEEVQEYSSNYLNFVHKSNSNIEQYKYHSYDNSNIEFKNKVLGNNISLEEDMLIESTINILEKKFLKVFLNEKEIFLEKEIIRKQREDERRIQEELDRWSSSSDDDNWSDWSSSSSSDSFGGSFGGSDSF